MGIEFISRFGAKTALFTDVDPEAIACIRENVAGITGCEVVVRQEDALSTMNNEQLTVNNEMKPRREAAHINLDPAVKPRDDKRAPRDDKGKEGETGGRLVVFIDPPYSDIKLGEKLVARLGAEAGVGTIVVWEVEAGGAPVFDGSQWEVLKDKVYGRARILILRKRSDCRGAFGASQ
jgi:16S rRNA G966 N2-methylase RsmD